MRDAAIGRTVSEETRAKMSAAKIGNTVPSKLSINRSYGLRNK